MTRKVHRHLSLSAGFIERVSGERLNFAKRGAREFRFSSGSGGEGGKRLRKVIGSLRGHGIRFTFGEIVVVVSAVVVVFVVAVAAAVVPW